MSCRFLFALETAAERRISRPSPLHCSSALQRLARFRVHNQESVFSEVRASLDPRHGLLGVIDDGGLDGRLASLEHLMIMAKARAQIRLQS